jgi:hypothetical protein
MEPSGWLKFSDQERLELPAERARELVNTLWEMALVSQGATTSAVKVGEAMRSAHLRRLIELHERESKAIRAALDTARS